MISRDCCNRCFSGNGRLPDRKSLWGWRKLSAGVPSDRFYDDIDGGHYGAGAGHCRVDRAADFTAVPAAADRIRRLFLY